MLAGRSKESCLLLPRGIQASMAAGDFMRKHAHWLLLFVLACKSSGSPPVASPPPEPAPAPAPETAPEPTPEPAPAPGPDKAAITSILDEIDSHLAELAKGHKGSEHRDAIEKLVSQLEPLLAGFEPGTAPYAKLKEHAKKFHDAQMKTGNSKDAGGHRTQVEDAVKELRSTL